MTIIPFCVPLNKPSKHALGIIAKNEGQLPVLKSQRIDENWIAHFVGVTVTVTGIEAVEVVPTPTFDAGIITAWALSPHIV